MKKIISICLITILVLLTFASCAKKDMPKEQSSGEVVVNTPDTTVSTTPNPFTGVEGYNTDAMGKRPVAIVVENYKAARPQWGIESPDIITEGEVEGGITRMLWIFADYTNVPDKIGPVRSARPPFVQFSELFDAIFIHWGGSESREGYVGGYDTIKNDGVPDIDGMDGGELFGRDNTRNVSSEHKGIVIGSKIEAAIADKGYRTDAKDAYYPDFTFYDEKSNVGSTPANTASVTFSSNTDARSFTYNTSDKQYHSSDWETDVSFENVIVLLASTQYITTSYYTGSVTYCNYSLDSGDGYLISNGTSTPIKWSGSSGELKLKDNDGNDLKLNKGRSYIALASSNHNGKVNIQ